MSDLPDLTFERDFAAIKAIDRVVAERDHLRLLLASAVKIADEAAEEWDKAPAGMRADAWAEEVDLTSIIKNATSPMRLSKIAPDEVRREFADRMEQQVYAIARQAFIEGMYRAYATQALDRFVAGMKADPPPTAGGMEE